MIYHTVNLRIVSTSEYMKWFESLGIKEQFQVNARLDRLAFEGHFGSIRYLGEKVSELKFRSGMRIYFGIVRRSNDLVLLVLGGDKNGQKKDIKRAKEIFRRETSNS